MYKVIVSQKKESTLNHWNESFLKRIPSRFMLMSTWNISILPAHLLWKKVFVDLACMSACCWGLPKPKYEPFITHNRGTSNFAKGTILPIFFFIVITYSPWYRSNPVWLFFFSKTQNNRFWRIVLFAHSNTPTMNGTEAFRHQRGCKSTMKVS